MKEMKMISKHVKEYIENEILSQYKSNIGGHGIDHIETVIARSFEIVEEFDLDVDWDMVYVIAAFHDIGYKQDPDNHEQVSADIFSKDLFVNQNFDSEKIKIMSEAIVDHRASLEYEARSKYGKIVSSADREISVRNMLERSLLFQKDKHIVEHPTLDQVIEYSFKKLSSKYGQNGYAKMYYPDQKYKDYLQEMRSLLSDKALFAAREKQIAQEIDLFGYQKKKQ